MTIVAGEALGAAVALMQDLHRRRERDRVRRALG
jgi:hypothetical protein